MQNKRKISSPYLIILICSNSYKFIFFEYKSFKARPWELINLSNFCYMKTRLVFMHWVQYCLKDKIIIAVTTKDWPATVHGLKICEVAASTKGFLARKLCQILANIIWLLAIAGIHRVKSSSKQKQLSGCVL